MKRYGIILAAGKGTRMKSDLYKVMHKVAGKPMVEHVVDQVQAAGADQIVAIVGHGAQMVQEYLGDRVSYALQDQQLGTGHAVLQAQDLLGDQEGTTLVVCGDTPLLQASTLQKLMDLHQATGASATILTAIAQDPTGYGRVIRDQDGSVLKNVEQKDASPEEALVKEINTGTYCFDNRALFQALSQVDNDNAQGEYYLPDVLEIMKKQGLVVSAYPMENFDEGLGVNDRVALAQAEKLMRARINEAHMRNGVTLIDPANTYIDSLVRIGSDTVIEPGVYLKGNTQIGCHCQIGAHSVLLDAVIEDHVQIKASDIEQSRMQTGSNAGPFAHLRPHADLGPNVHVGNFVEVKNATIGQDTKIGHLTYVGDADLGQDINVGCGTIFVNYDGKNKHRSTVGDHVFIGCNANIVSPVTIGDKAFIAAGSTITQDVPAEAMAIARAKQTNKEGYASKLPGHKVD